MLQNGNDTLGQAQVPQWRHLLMLPPQNSQDDDRAWDVNHNKGFVAPNGGASMRAQGALEVATQAEEEACLILFPSSSFGVELQPSPPSVLDSHPPLVFPRNKAVLHSAHEPHTFLLQDGPTIFQRPFHPGRGSKRAASISLSPARTAGLRAEPSDHGRSGQTDTHVAAAQAGIWPTTRRHLSCHQVPVLPNQGEYSSLSEAVSGSAVDRGHKRQIHSWDLNTRAQPYICGVCGRCFAKHQSLGGHMGSHKGGPPSTRKRTRYREDQASHATVPRSLEGPPPVDTAPPTFALAKPLPLGMQAQGLAAQRPALAGVTAANDQPQLPQQIFSDGQTPCPGSSKERMHAPCSAFNSSEAECFRPGLRMSGSSHTIDYLATSSAGKWGLGRLTRDFSDHKDNTRICMLEPNVGKVNKCQGSETRSILTNLLPREQVDENPMTGPSEAHEEFGLEAAAGSLGTCRQQVELLNWIASRSAPPQLPVPDQPLHGIGASIMHCSGGWAWGTRPVSQVMIMARLPA